MSQVCREAVVPYTCEQMYALVNEVETYQDFLPWCESSVIDQRSDAHSMVATLSIAHKGIRTQFTTHNQGKPYEEILMLLDKGPFKHLHGEWKFIPLGDLGCRVTLNFEYVFSNIVYEKLLNKLFDHIVETIIDAFLRRAQQCYGETA